MVKKRLPRRTAKQATALAKRTRTAAQDWTQASGFVTLREVTYELTPPNLTHFAKIETYWRSTKEDPVETLANDPNMEKFSPAVQAAMASEAVRLRHEDATDDSTTVKDWIRSPHGMTYMLWVLARERSEDIGTWDEFYELYDPTDTKKALTIPEVTLLMDEIDLMTFDKAAAGKGDKNTVDAE